MPPDDLTPLGDAMTHRFENQKIPDAKPNAGEAAGDKRASDIAQRPGLPEHPERMTADIEDEEADPVVDSGPGIADGMKSLKKQQGGLGAGPRQTANRRRSGAPSRTC